jgi:capsular polysaccharide biosynthesis protein
MILVRDIKEIAAHVRPGSTPRVGFHKVEPAGISGMRPPLFLLGPANEDLLAQMFGQIDTPAVGCYDVGAAMVAPTGIAIRDGVALHDADAFVQPRHHVIAVSDRLNAAALPVRHVAGPLAVIYGPAHETWGHWLVDFLPRLWVLHASGHALDKLQFLMPPDLRGFARELLLLCGLSPDQIVTYRYWKEVISTDHLLMPTGLRAGNRLAPCFDVATEFWVARARAAAGVVIGAGGSALFLSRADAAQERVVQNRDVVERAAVARGLRVVHPEMLPPAEQIALFGTAALMCGEYGSGLHNAVFAAPGAVVCALRGTSRHPSFVQSGIATALRQEVGYVFGATDGQDVMQSFRVDVGLLETALRLGEIKNVLF